MLVVHPLKVSKAPKSVSLSAFVVNYHFSPPADDISDWINCIYRY